jgi:hypothetical protein
MATFFDVSCCGSILMLLASSRFWMTSRIMLTESPVPLRPLTSPIPVTWLFSWPRTWTRVSIEVRIGPSAPLPACGSKRSPRV